MTLNPNKFGVRVECLTCGRPKNPRGRDAGVYMASSYCTREGCQGYDDEPRAGSLWPGESEADFGFPVCDCCGVEVREETGG